MGFECGLGLKRNVINMVRKNITTKTTITYMVIVNSNKNVLLSPSVAIKPIYY